MKTSVYLFSAFMSIFLFDSCSKSETIIDPVACLSMEKNTWKLDENVVAENCGDADNVWYRFAESSVFNSQDFQDESIFETLEENQVSVELPLMSAGDYIIEFRFFNEQSGTKILTVTEDFTVID